MRLVLATNHFSSLGGSQTYLLTVAQHLLRLGHDPMVFTLELGETSELAQERGIPVTDVDAELPDDCDGLLVQDGVVAPLLAERYPNLQQLFVVHSADVDISFPPAIADWVHTVVVLNARVERAVRALPGEHEIVRLRQPIDLDRFQPTGVQRERPRRALIHSNYLHGSRREILLEALADCGIESLQVGAHGIAMADPRPAMAEADVVFGYGRSVLEAMACGRAAYVLDHLGGDGWVTRRSYPKLEADGFYGSATDDTVDTDRLHRDLAEYRREMGTVGADLARLHHNARVHAIELIDLIRNARPGPERVHEPLRELSRLRRVAWEAESRAAALAREGRVAREDADRLRGIENLACEAFAAADALKSTRRYRFAAALARPLDRLRSLRVRHSESPSAAPSRTSVPDADRHGPAMVVLAPHPDDAALSCWSVLQGSGEVAVVTVFAGMPDDSAEPSPGDHLAGFDDARAAIGARVREDRKAMALLGRELMQLPFIDAAYRRDEPRETDLVWAIGSALVPGDHLFAPAGIGAHPDHVAVRQAALELLAEGYPVTFYADFPYAAAFGWPHWVTGASADARPRVDRWWQSHARGTGVSLDEAHARIVRLAPTVRDAKLELLRTYGSQFSLLEAGPQGRLTNHSLSSFEVYWPPYVEQPATDGVRAPAAERPLIDAAPDTRSDSVLAQSRRSGER